MVRAEEWRVAEEDNRREGTKIGGGAAHSGE